MLESIEFNQQNLIKPNQKIHTAGVVGGKYVTGTVLRVVGTG